MTSGPTPRRYVELVETMGTIVSVDVRAEEATAAFPGAVRSVSRRLERIDELFSPWRPESWVSRLIAGRARVEDCPVEVRDVVELARCLTDLTDGYFSAFWRTSPERRGPDPTGLVKGWAAQQASDVLLAHGLPDHVVNAAGDLVLCGGPEAGRPPGGTWRVGISDPAKVGSLAGVVELPAGPSRWAVATSGVAELGLHVVDPHTGVMPRSVAAATAVARIDGATEQGGALADACATALVAAGDSAGSLVHRLGTQGTGAFFIADDGAVHDPSRILTPAPPL